MKREEIESHLWHLEIPEPDAELKAKALHRATLALGTDSFGSDPLPGTVRHPWLTPALTALVILLGVYILVQPSQPDKKSLSHYSEVLEEIDLLFPGRISSLIWKNGELAVEISEPTGDSGHPIEILLTKGDEHIQVISYSGQKVCLDMKGRKACFEVLYSGSENEVFLVGREFIWTPQEHSTFEGYRIQVHSMKKVSS